MLNYLSLISLIYLALGISACGDYAIYDKHDSNLHGQRIKFNVEMVYVPINELVGKVPDEKKKYKYLLIQKSYALKIYTIAETNYETIKQDMEFTIIKTYLSKVVGFVGDDVRMMVLKDENGIISVISISFLKKTNLDRSAYARYLL